MTITYSVTFYEAGIQPNGLYSVETIGNAFELIFEYLKSANHDVTVVIAEHQIERDCDICSAGSVRRSIQLEYPVN